MPHMFINLLNYIMFIIATVMSCDIVSDIVCMLCFLCKIIITLKINKFNYSSHIDIITSVYGIMFIDNSIINEIMIRLFLYLKLCWFYNYQQHMLYIGLYV